MGCGWLVVCSPLHEYNPPQDSRATKGHIGRTEAGSEYELEVLQLVVDEQSHEISLALWPS